MEDPIDTRNLVRFGFLSKKGKEFKKSFDANFKIRKEADPNLDKEKEWNKKIDSLTLDKLHQYAGEEVGEEQYNQFARTGFPETFKSKRFRLLWEKFDIAIEEVYFWIHNHLTTDWAFPYIVKTKDLFTASENSSFFGASQQRLGAQQDKVSQFLAVIGKMVKELFQVVRELRIIDERTKYYYNSQGIYKDPKGNYTLKKKTDQSSEITLKGIWIDLVEQGAKNPASVYGMARELQFTTLPDLFFNAPHMETDKVDSYVDSLDFNKAVKNVLKRKLKTFLSWKETTFEELKNRRTFTLKYLWQHYDVIKMYMSWVRPYLSNIRRMHMDVEKTKTADLVAAFEGSMIELEFLAAQLPVNDNTGKQNKKVYAVILVHFMYRTRPIMGFQQEYQRGPQHMGRVVFTVRPYVWTKEQIENFVKYREKQDFELMKSISGSVEAAMKALGGDIQKYLKEAGRIEYENPESDIMKSDGKTDKSGNPFSALFSIFKSSKPAPSYNKEAETGSAGGVAKTVAWKTYENFKKAHGMFSW